MGCMNHSFPSLTCIGLSGHHLILVSQSRRNNGIVEVVSLSDAVLEDSVKVLAKGVGGQLLVGESHLDRDLFASFHLQLKVRTHLRASLLGAYGIFLIIDQIATAKRERERERIKFDRREREIGG